MVKGKPVERFKEEADIVKTLKKENDFSTYILYGFKGEQWGEARADKDAAIKMWDEDMDKSF